MMSWLRLFGRALCLLSVFLARQWSLGADRRSLMRNLLVDACLGQLMANYSNITVNCGCE
jgi:hypothetical protein